MKLPFIIFFLFVFCSGKVQASLISSSATLANGNQVALQGLEWMPLTYTAGLSRIVVENTNGFTDRFGNSWSSDEWRYATRLETETLINSLWGGTYDGWSVDNADGASWFLNNFGAIGYDTGYGDSRINNTYSDPASWVNKDLAYFLFGDVGDCSSNVSLSCRGLVQFAESSSTAININPIDLVTNPNGTPVGFFRDDLGLDAGLYDGNDIAVNVSGYFERGSLLVRQVPAPPTLAIFALGMIGLGARRFKK
jgi:hypothetical protein